jgi:endonuclease/exonuclease/phosphatase family metal-dependent hydrolase
VLSPADILLGSPQAGGAGSVLRPLDLRRSALNFLDRQGDDVEVSPPFLPPVWGGLGGRTFRIMTYNVHSCIGMDGKLAPERIARIIARYAPDIIALQELDVGRKRTDHIHQAQYIAHYLQMEFHFHAALQIQEEHYGNAVLTHFPMRLINKGMLPGLPGKPRLEPRGALCVAIDACGTEIRLINTHLGLNRQERQAQVEALTGSDWLAHPNSTSPTILCGDFNASPRSREWRELHNRLPDAQVTLAGHRPRSTFFTRLPHARIDHVFVSSSLQPVTIETPNTELVRLASDHLPLVVELYPLSDMTRNQRANPATL